MLGAAKAANALRIRLPTHGVRVIRHSSGQRMVKSAANVRFLPILSSTHCYRGEGGGKRVQQWRAHTTTSSPIGASGAGRGDGSVEDIKTKSKYYGAGASAVDDEVPPGTEDMKLHDRFLACVEQSEASDAISLFAAIACAGGPLVTLRRRQLLVMLCAKGMVEESSNLLADATYGDGFDSRDSATMASYIYVIGACLRQGHLDRARNHFSEASARGMALDLPLCEELAGALFLEGLRDGESKEKAAWGVVEYMWERGMRRGVLAVCDEALLGAAATSNLSFALRVCEYLTRRSLCPDPTVRKQLHITVWRAMLGEGSIDNAAQEEGKTKTWEGSRHGLHNVPQDYGDTVDAAAVTLGTLLQTWAEGDLGDILGEIGDDDGDIGDDDGDIGDTNDEDDEDGFGPGVEYDFNTKTNTLTRCDSTEDNKPYRRGEEEGRQGGRGEREGRTIEDGDLLDRGRGGNDVDQDHFFGDVADFDEEGVEGFGGETEGVGGAFVLDEDHVRATHDGVRSVARSRAASDTTAAVATAACAESGNKHEDLLAGDRMRRSVLKDTDADDRIRGEGVGTGRRRRSSGSGVRGNNRNTASIEKKSLRNSLPSSGRQQEDEKTPVDGVRDDYYNRGDNESDSEDNRQRTNNSPSLVVDWGGEAFCGDLAAQLLALHPDKGEVSFLKETFSDSGGRGEWGNSRGKFGDGGTTFSDEDDERDSTVFDIDVPVGGGEGRGWGWEEGGGLEGEQEYVTIRVRVKGNHDPEAILQSLLRHADEDDDDDHDDDK